MPKLHGARLRSSAGAGRERLWEQTDNDRRRGPRPTAMLECTCARCDQYERGLSIPADRVGLDAPLCRKCSRSS